MRVLLDECLPRRLAHELTGHVVSTAPKEGFAGLKNGKLLVAAQENWDVLLTTDAKIPSEQVLARFKIGILIVRVVNNDFATLTPWIPEILRTLPFVKPGMAVTIGDPKLLRRAR